jgi:hypothetical protein
MKKYRLNKILQTGFISFAFLWISCDLCYYCEEATFKFIPEKMEAGQDGKEIFVFHFMNGTVGGTNDEAPAGTKFTLEYYWSESSSDYSSGTKIANAKGGALVYNYSYGDWEPSGDIPTTQMPSEFEYVLNTENTRTGYIFSFDVPDGLDNGTYYVHAVAKCSCGGEEGSTYTNLGVVTTIDLSVDLEVYPYSTISYSSGSPLSSVTQNDTVWINASLSSTPAIGDLSELSGSVTSKFGDITILSGSGSSLYDALQGKVFWNDYYTKFYYATILGKDSYAPGTYDLTLTINQNTYNESNPANNTATKSIEVKALPPPTIVVLNSTFSEGPVLLAQPLGDPSWVTHEYAPGVKAWRWTDKAPQGSYSQAMGKIASTTASDGFLILDLDLYSTKQSTSSLYSPLFEMPASDSTLLVEFEYYFRQYRYEEFGVYLLAYDSNTDYWKKNDFENYAVIEHFEYDGNTTNVHKYTSNPEKISYDATNALNYFRSNNPGKTLRLRLYFVFVNKGWTGYALMLDDVKVTRSKSASGKIQISNFNNGIPPKFDESGNHELFPAPTKEELQIHKKRK